MPMKISLALGPRQPLSRQTAWGCFTTNLAMPGFGSLLAGRKLGYPQAVLCIVGLILTMILGVRFAIWIIPRYSALQNPEGDPFEGLQQMWLQLRWPLLGIAVFALAWLWALTTSLTILREARDSHPRVPPKLEPPRLI